MTETGFRALVVDDEPAVRGLTVRSLAREGFICDIAVDGHEAELKVSQNSYDLVVADLRMPNKHGHALASGMLQRADHPLLVVLTGCHEPRLARDLLARGVDDVFFKPVDYGLFCAKLRTMVEKRRREQAAAAAPGGGRLEVPQSPSPRSMQELQPISLAEFDKRLAGIRNLTPLSSVALDVFNLTRDGDTNAKAIAKTLSQDPALTAEVLRLANSAYYNPGRRTIVNLDEGITLIGFRRLGELALASSALAALTGCSLSWLDASTTWQRGVAAGMASELLVERFGHKALGDGLVLCSLMYSMGRVILGTLFPDEYARFVAHCRGEGIALRDVERQFLPLSHAAAASRLLSDWGIPAELHLPMQYQADSFRALSRLGEPMRSRVTLIKLAIWFGRLVVGQWEPWDWLDLPSAADFQRLRISSLNGLEDQLVKNLASVVPPQPPARSKTVAPAIRAEIPYYQLANPELDVMRPLLHSLGYEVRPIAAGNGPALINGLDVPAADLTRCFDSWDSTELVIVAGRNPPIDLTPFGRVLTLPASVAEVRAALQSLEQATSAADEPAEVAG